MKPKFAVICDSLSDFSTYCENHKNKDFYDFKIILTPKDIFGKSFSKYECLNGNSSLKRLVEIYLTEK